MLCNGDMFSHLVRLLGRNPFSIPPSSPAGLFSHYMIWLQTVGHLRHRWTKWVLAAAVYHCLLGGRRRQKKMYSCKSSGKWWLCASPTNETLLIAVHFCESGWIACIAYPFLTVHAHWVPRELHTNALFSSILMFGAHLSSENEFHNS